MENAKRQFAASLLEIKAVMLSPRKPFVWASGWYSPIYCDNRKILSHPELRSLSSSLFAERVRLLSPDAEFIAGVATGAIAIGALVADRLGLPYVYVRPKPKDHGTGSQIEGELPEGSKVVVVEDLVSTGMSSLASVCALRTAGAEVKSMEAFFTYDFPQARHSFAEMGVELDTLTDYQTLIEVAVQTGYITEDDLELLQEWRRQPSRWRVSRRSDEPI